MKKVNDLDHLSYSSISLYLECARKWRYRYLDQLPSPTPPALAFGSAFHSTVQEMHTAIAAGKEPDTSVLWSQNWQNVVDRGIDFEDELPETVRADGIRLLGSPAATAALKSLKPYVDTNGPFVERRIELQVPGVPVPVIGYIDLVTSDGVLTDMKTAGRSWGSEQAGQESQPLVYLAAANQMGLYHRPNTFRHLVFVKSRTPTVQVLESRHEDAEVYWVFSVIAEVWKGIQQGVYPPSPKACFSWGRRCEFWDICRGRK